MGRFLPHGLEVRVAFGVQMGWRRGDAIRDILMRLALSPVGVDVVRLSRRGERAFYSCRESRFRPGVVVAINMYTLSH